MSAAMGTGMGWSVRSDLEDGGLSHFGRHSTMSIVVNPNINITIPEADLPNALIQNLISFCLFLFCLQSFFYIKWTK